MKKIERDDFQVRVTLDVLSLHELGFIAVEGRTLGTVELVILPQRLGDFGSVSMSDGLASRDVEGDYLRRCNALLEQIRRQRHVLSGGVEWTETATCSHCGSDWEEETAEGIAAYPDDFLPGDGPGLPVCCERAQAEWRTAQTAGAA